MNFFILILSVSTSLSIFHDVQPLPTNLVNRISEGKSNGNSITSYSSFQEYLKSRNSTLRSYMRARSPPASDMVEIKDFITTEEIPRPLGMFGTKPLSEEQRQKITNENKAFNFMKQFGYISQGGDITDFLITPSGFEETIKKVQTFGNIPITGKLDQKTIELMSSPRCGVPDIAKANIEGGPSGGLSTVERRGHVVTRVNSSSHSRPKRFIVGGSGWNKRHISYHIENYSSKLHNMTNVERELKKAFDAWSSYARLNFTLTADRNADIIVYFAEYDHYDGYPFDGQGGTLAHAYYPREFGHYGGDIHFDESEQWTINPTDENSGLDFFTVAVHEIGHSLGLAHSPVSTSIMFPYYKGSESPETFTLDYDDILGMYELYIQRQLPGDDKFFNQNHDGSKSESTTQTSRTSTSTTVTPTEDDKLNDEDYPTEEERRHQGESDDKHLINSDENDSSNTGGSGSNANNDKTNNANTNTTFRATYVDNSNASNATILYHGDSMSVDEYHRALSRQDLTTPTIPVFFPVDEEEQRRKWEEEEKKRREEERKWYEEEAIRREEAAKKREEERRKYEEEIKRKEEETRREYEESLERREQERKNEEERRRKLEEERIKRQEEERMKAYEEELRKYEEELRRNREAQENNNRKNSSSVDTPTVGDVICDGNIDSAAKIRGDIFMFKGESMWRFGKRREMMPGYPAPIRALFSGLPEWTNRIDAAYERQNDSVIIFFIGNSFYEHRVNQITPSVARPLSDLGLPSSVTQLDSVLFWPKNNKVYFFRHSEYWRYDEATGAIETGYPQPMDRWYGIPSFLDAAITLTTKSSYFFKGDQFFEFDNQQVISVPGYPKRTQDYWFSHC